MLAEDDNADLWIKSDGGAITRYRDGRFEAVESKQAGYDFDGGHRRGAETVWFRQGTELRRVRNGSLSTFAVPDGSPKQIYEDRQGRLWIGASRPGMLAVLAGETLRVYTFKDGLPSAPVISFGQDRAGNLWFGTRGGGLIRFKEESFTVFTTAQGLSSDSISCIYEDSEGTLWLGTPNNGLMRAVPQVITSYTEKDGLTGKAFYPVLEDRAGNVRIGNRGVNRFRSGRFEFFPLDSLFSPARDTVNISTFYEDRVGRLLLGTGRELLVFQDERFSVAPVEAFPRAPLAIHQDRQGAFWYGFFGGLYREQNGVRQWFGPEDGLREAVQPIVEDRQGRVWIGSYGGLAVYADGRLRLYTQRDGLSSNRIRAIYEDADGVLWIGTYDGGLNRLQDGKFTRYTTTEGLFSNNVFSILEDRRGNFWMGGNQGIQRVSRRQLNEFAEARRQRIDAVAYGKADGMTNVECNGGKHPAAIKASDGRMWFPTLNGVAVVDPETVEFNTVPPPVVIESITLDRVALNLRNRVEIYPHHAQLEIAYAGLSFIKPEHVRFKYRMEGLDQEWNEVGNRRTAYYTHPRAGRYLFRVAAANSDEVWNETGATIEVLIHPPIWGTPWFRGGMVLLCTMLGVLLYRRRIRKLEQARAAQEAFARRLLASQEGERKRIAAELHDGLGQNLLVIKNWAMPARRALETGSKACAPLDEVTAAAMRSIEEAREIAHNLRPYHLDEIGLTEAVAAMTERIAEASGLKFNLELDNLRGLLSPDAEINLYRIIQEAINNIVKHAQAETVELSLRRHSQKLTVVIKDNGRGFDPAEAARRRNRGFGLTGLVERVRLLGGREQIHSAPGKGTTITVILDIP